MVRYASPLNVGVFETSNFCWSRFFTYVYIHIYMYVDDLPIFHGVRYNHAFLGRTCHVIHVQCSIIKRSTDVGFSSTSRSEISYKRLAPRYPIRCDNEWRKSFIASTTFVVYVFHTRASLVIHKSVYLHRPPYNTI